MNVAALFGRPSLLVWILALGSLAAYLAFSRMPSLRIVMRPWIPSQFVGSVKVWIWISATWVIVAIAMPSSAHSRLASDWGAVAGILVAVSLTSLAMAIISRSWSAWTRTRLTVAAVWALVALFGAYLSVAAPVLALLPPSMAQPGAWLWFAVIGLPPTFMRLRATWRASLNPPLSA